MPTFASQSPPPTESPLQILAAGVETSEDAPFAPADYRFLPGDYIYVQFQIAGYAVQTTQDGALRKISLTYEISPQDEKGILLTPAVSGVIQEELNAEDKNWLPKRRASFLLPSFVAAAQFHLHLAVKDLYGNTSAERDISFHIGGTLLVPAPALSVQDFQFLRKEDDIEPLDVPAYRPGDTVHARFIMAGFRLAPGNEYRLSYGLAVTRPDGKLYLDEPTAAELSNRSFYPAQFVSGNLAITTARNAPRGQYLLLLTVRDLNASQTRQVKRVFTLE